MFSYFGQVSACLVCSGVSYLTGFLVCLAFFRPLVWLCLEFSLAIIVGILQVFFSLNGLQHLLFGIFLWMLLCFVDFFSYYLWVPNVCMFGISVIANLIPQNVQEKLVALLEPLAVGFQFVFVFVYLK